MFICVICGQKDCIVEKFLFKEETYAIIGAMMEVHKILGHGFLEAVYQEALSIEFDKRNIPYEQEEKVDITYKGIHLDKFYIADFICFREIVVEIKALSSISSDHEAQLINYLKATGLRVGILANFGEKSLTYKRMIY